MLDEFIIRTRSYRRFDQTHAIEAEDLRDLVDLARLTASGANLQPLRYAIVSDPATRKGIFKNLSWAGYLPEWPGPAKGERPTGYIIMLSEGDLPGASIYDPGIAAQTSTLLEATTRGLGGCMLAAIDRDGIRKVLDLPDEYSIIMVIALGLPAESIVLEPIGEDGSIKYFRDADDVHHVPKRSLDDVVVLEFP